MRILKKIIEYIGLGFTALIFFGGIIILMRAIYQNPWVSLIVLISCPFMAFSFLKDKESYKKKSLNIILMTILILSGVCSFSIMSGKGKQEVLLDNIFLKGEKKHHPVWVDAEESDNGDYSPPHYETEYYFQLAPNQPEILFSIIDWGLVIITFGIPVLVYFITKNDLS